MHIDPPARRAPPQPADPRDRRTVLMEAGAFSPDAQTVEALARLQLAARRSGCSILLVHASPELRDLVAFMGLSDVLPGLATI